MNESVIKSDIRKALGREPALVLWPIVQGGVVQHDDVTYKAGSVNGMSDLIGVLRVELTVPEDGYGSEPITCGRFIALEVKTPKHLKTILNAIAKGTTAKLSKSDREQILFLGVVRSRGGFGAFVDSVESAQAALERARRGERE